MKRLATLSSILILVAGCISADDVEDRQNDITDQDGDGYASVFYDGDDCDDDDDDIHPGAEEVAYDGIDNDCSAETPDDDLDGDGYALEQDCNDDDGDIHPAADELCGDEIDNNCDELVDDDTSADALTWYRDNDNDGYADETVSVMSCVEVSGYIAPDSEGAWDCDDSNELANPDMVETCNTDFDDDCDGTANVEDSADCEVYYFDGDEDGYGLMSVSSCLCEPDEGEMLTSTSGADCDDLDSEVNPGAREMLGDESDWDCDGGDDSFAMALVDTRSASQVYGPRLHSAEDEIALAWIAEELIPDGSLEFDGRGLSVWDTTEDNVDEDQFYSFTESTDAGELGSAWDFQMDSDYWVFLSSVYSNPTRTTSFFSIDRYDQSTGGNSWTKNAPLFEDLQLSLTYTNTTYVTGCGTNGSGIMISGDYISGMVDGGSPSADWEGPIWNYSWNYETSTWEADGTVTTQTYDTCELGDGTDRFYWRFSNFDDAVMDQVAVLSSPTVIWRGTDYESYGASYYDMESSYNNGVDLWGRLYDYGGPVLYLYTDGTNFTTLPEYGVDIDVSSSPGGASAACVVYDDGTMDLFYGYDVGNGLALDSIEVGVELGGGIEECAVTITENTTLATLAVAARSGDDIAIGFAHIE